MVAGPARGAILGACFRPWCDKRRPRSRSRLFLGRPVRHPGTSAVGARAATRHPGNKRQVLLLACLRACPRGGAPTALRPACVVTRLPHACAATQPRRRGPARRRGRTEREPVQLPDVGRHARPRPARVAGVVAAARKVSGWPKICKLARACLRGCRMILKAEVGPTSGPTNENCTGLTQIARLGPTLWLKNPY